MHRTSRPHRDLDDRGARTGAATDLLAAVIAAVLRSLSWLARAMQALAMAALDGMAALRGVAARCCRRGRAGGAAACGSLVTAWRRAVLTVGVAYLRARAHRLTTIGAPPAHDVAPPRRAFTGTFATTAFQNPWLPVGGRTVEAVVRVELVDAGLPAPHDVARAEVLLLDSSGSMGLPWSKLRALRWAATAALEALPDGTWFAIVRGNQRAEVLYPPAGGLAIASLETRQEAARALRLLCPEGGTAMGRWLLLARDLCAGYEGAIAHATLITDGRNESESPDELARAVTAVAGHLQCDCRGVGQEWEVAELQQVASALIGTVDIVAEPRDLADGLRQVAEDATARCVDGVELRLWLARGVTVRAIREVHPTVEELVATATAPDTDARGLRSTYATGAWRPGTRDYQVSLLVPAHVAGERMVAARCSVVVNGTAAAEAAISVGWTDDVSLDGGPDPVVTHYAAQRELVESIREGLASRAGGDEPTASAKLGRARDLAVATGHDATARLIDDVLEDDVDGTTRVRRVGERAAEMTLASRSSRTVGFGRPTRRPPTDTP